MIKCDGCERVNPPGGVRTARLEKPAWYGADRTGYGARLCNYCILMNADTEQKRQKRQKRA